MGKKEKNVKKERFSFDHLKKKHILLFRNSYSLVEHHLFTATKIQFILFSLLAVVLLVGGTLYVMAFTGVRTYIPGYTDPKLSKRLYFLEQQADSLSGVVMLQDTYIKNMQAIFLGDLLLDPGDTATAATINPADVRYTRSLEESLLRMEIEDVADYALLSETQHRVNSEYFALPVFGYINNKFSIVDHHYGVDFTAKPDSPIYATLDGVVISSDWNPDFGHTIIIQHSNNFVSMYKHNASRIKQVGDYVKAGDVIAFIGNSGHASTGPHLHFELWHKGIPENPEFYLRFD